MESSWEFRAGLRERAKRQVGIRRARANLTGLLRSAERRIPEESLSRAATHERPLRARPQVQHALHSRAQLIAPQQRPPARSLCPFPAKKLTTQRGFVPALGHTVGGTGECSWKLGPGIFPREEAALPVALALAVPEDQTISFDLGLLRASQVRSSALLITHPPDKSHLNEEGSPRENAASRGWAVPPHGVCTASPLSDAKLPSFPEFFLWLLLP